MTESETARIAAVLVDEAPDLLVEAQAKLETRIAAAAKLESEARQVAWWRARGLFPAYDLYQNAVDGRADAEASLVELLRLAEHDTTPRLRHVALSFVLRLLWKIDRARQRSEWRTLVVLARRLVDRAAERDPNWKWPDSTPYESVTAMWRELVRLGVMTVEELHGLARQVNAARKANTA